MQPTGGAWRPMDRDADVTDELYADTRDAGTVRRLLQGCVAPTVTISDETPDVTLGLTRWRLPAIEAELAQLAGNPPAHSCGFDDGPRAPLTDLDSLLTALRRHAQAHY